MPGNLLQSLTCVGGLIARITWTLFGCCLIPVLVRTSQRDSVSIVQNFNLGALTCKPTSCNLVRTNLK